MIDHISLLQAAASHDYENKEVPGERKPSVPYENSKKNAAARNSFFAVPPNVEGPPSENGAGGLSTQEQQGDTARAASYDADGYLESSLTQTEQPKYLHLEEDSSRPSSPLLTKSIYNESYDPNHVVDKKV